jgi:hypothetical protein
MPITLARFDQTTWDDPEPVFAWTPFYEAGFPSVRLRLIWEGAVVPPVTASTDLNRWPASTPSTQGDTTP